MILSALPLGSVGTDTLDALRWAVGLLSEAFHAYGWLLASIARWTHSLFESYGYWVIFLATLTENTLLLGLFVPGAIVIVLAGVSAHEGVLALPPALALGLLGTVLGDTISYAMGRFGWSRVIRLQSALTFAERIREPILQRGPLFVLFYHFAGYTRLVGPAGAGFLRMPYRRWAPADHLGALLWVGSFLGLGYGLGVAGINLDSSDRWFRYFEWGLLLLVVVWMVYLYRSGKAMWVKKAWEKLAEESNRQQATSNKDGDEEPVAADEALEEPAAVE